MPRVLAALAFQDSLNTLGQQSHLEGQAKVRRAWFEARLESHRAGASPAFSRGTLTGLTLSVF